MPMGLNVSPPMWQSYINKIFNCLESRKYCEAIMDNLLLFTPSKQSRMIKLEDLLMALLKNGLKISPKNANYLEKNCSIWAIPSLFKRKECARPLCNRLEAIQRLKPLTLPYMYIRR